MYLWCAGRSEVGGYRRRELRRGQQSGARRAGAPSPRWSRDHRQELCSYPRDEPEEARTTAANLRQAQRLRQGAAR